MIRFVSGMCFFFAVGMSNAQVFEFESADTGEVLATIEFSGFPAGPDEFVGLSFTPAGQAIFGFGEFYDGVFDTSEFGPLVQSNSGGQSDLSGDTTGGGLSIGDLLDNSDPEDSSFHASGTLSFQVTSGLVGGSLTALPNDQLTDSSIIVGGVFSAVVPEPSCLALALIGLGCLGGRRSQARF